MRVKTSKLRNLERNRKSILTDDLEHCFICKRQATDLHEIYSAGSRKASMEHDFVAPLCRQCHQNITLNYGLNLRLKRLCQEKFEEMHERSEFLSIIHKSYLE